MSQIRKVILISGTGHRPPKEVKGQEKEAEGFQKRPKECAMCHNMLVCQIIVYHREWQQLKGS